MALSHLKIDLHPKVTTKRPRSSLRLCVFARKHAFPALRITRTRRLTKSENEIATAVVDAAIHIHRKLGPALLESVYETVLAYELKKRGFTVEQQTPITIAYDEQVFDNAFRADLIVNGIVIIELKSVEQISKTHRKQIQTYIRLSDRKLGLLLNFGEYLMKNGVVRAVNGLED